MLIGKVFRAGVPRFIEKEIYIMSSLNVIATGKVDVVSVSNVAADEMRQIKQFDRTSNKETDTPVLVDGKPVFRVPRTVALRQDGEVISNVSIRVHQPSDITALKPYMLVNPRFTSYVRDGFVSWSITADAIQEVK